MRHLMKGVATLAVVSSPFPPAPATRPAEARSTRRPGARRREAGDREVRAGGARLPHRRAQAARSELEKGNYTEA